MVWIIIALSSIMYSIAHCHVNSICTIILSGYVITNPSSTSSCNLKLADQNIVWSFFFLASSTSKAVHYNIPTAEKSMKVTQSKHSTNRFWVLDYDQILCFREKIWFGKQIKISVFFFKFNRRPDWNSILLYEVGLVYGA